MPGKLPLLCTCSAGSFADCGCGDERDRRAFFFFCVLHVPLQYNLTERKMINCCRALDTPIIHHCDTIKRKSSCLGLCSSQQALQPTGTALDPMPFLKKKKTPALHWLHSKHLHHVTHETVIYSPPFDFYFLAWTHKSDSSSASLRNKGKETDVAWHPQIKSSRWGPPHAGSLSGAPSLWSCAL